VEDTRKGEKQFLFIYFLKLLLTGLWHIHNQLGILELSTCIPPAPLLISSVFDNIIQNKSDFLTCMIIKVNFFSHIPVPVHLYKCHLCPPKGGTIFFSPILLLLNFDIFLWSKKLLILLYKSKHPSGLSFSSLVLELGGRGILFTPMGLLCRLLPVPVYSKKLTTGRCLLFVWHFADIKAAKIRAEAKSYRYR